MNGLHILYYSAEHELTRGSEMASGHDLRALLGVPLIEIAPHTVERVPTGVHLRLPYLGIEAQVRPRSGHTARGLVAQLGTIDGDYTGPVDVLLANIRSVPQVVYNGERIAQLVFAPICVPDKHCQFTALGLRRVDTLKELGSTERGSAGFGSTGTH